MNDTFVHSIKVPTQYKKAAKILKSSIEQGASLKGEIFTEKHAKTNRLYALMIKIAQNKEILDQLIDKSEILKIEQKLDKYLCLILITELLFGAKKLNGQSKPVECVRSYEDKFQKLLLEIQAETSQQQNDVANIENASNNNNNNENNKQANQSNYLKPRYVRVNTNLMSRTDAIDAFQKDGWQNKYEDQKFNNYQEFLTAIKELDDYDFLTDLHVNNLFIFPASSKRYWAGHHLVLESKLILQDKASCLPSMLLNPSKKSVVLDMCAAPGMKTTHLSAIMKDKGRIYAVEQNERRYQTLLEFIRNTKSSIVVPMYNDCLALGPDDLPKVEYILIDPPCSGSGMTNRLSILSTTMQKTESERLSKLAGLQIKMLTHALQSFPNAKKVVYSTCSINPEENEEVIQRCLQLSAEQYGWELIKPPEFADLWKNFGSPKYKHIGKKCIYAKASEDYTDGFFVAILERKLDAVGNFENINEPMFDESHADDQQNMNNYNNNQYNVDDNIINENIQTEADEIYGYNQMEQSESIYNEPTKNKSEHLKNVDESNEMEQKKKKRKSKHNNVEKNANETESSNNAAIDEHNQMEPKKKKRKSKHDDTEKTNNTLAATLNNVEIEENNQIEQQKKKKKSKNNVIEQTNNKLEPSNNVDIDKNNNMEEKKKKRKSKHNVSEQTNNKLETSSNNVEIKENNQIDIEQINKKLTPSNVEIIQNNQMESEKKKSKHTNIEQTNNNLEATSNIVEINENQIEHKKKKKKSKHTVVEQTNNNLAATSNNVDIKNQMEPEKKKKKLKHTVIEQTTSKLQATLNNVEIKTNNQIEPEKKKKKSKHTDIEQANNNLEATSNNIEMKENNQIEPEKKKKKLKHTYIEQTTNKLEATSINVEVKINNQIEPEKKKKKSKHADAEQTNVKLETSNNVDINHNQMEEKKKKRKSKHNDN